MSNNKRAHIFVIGNEKGGAGKTTCTMHLISGLLERGVKVASIDVDSRQHSLTNYFHNREAYNKHNPAKPVLLSEHHYLDGSKSENDEQSKFENLIDNLISKFDYIVVDTPGSCTFLSRLAHSYADTVITPINDSFVDIDVMAKIDAQTLKVMGPSIYSQMIWEQKMHRAQRDGGTINWIVMRNRLSNLDAINKRNVDNVLNQLSKKISYKLIPGFSERVIFKELFLQGLTLLDLNKANYIKKFNISHVAAREELRNFLNSVLNTSQVGCSA